MRPTTPLEYVNKALILAIDRQNHIPGSPIYATVIAQLEYIRGRSRAHYQATFQNSGGQRCRWRPRRIPRGKLCRGLNINQIFALEP
ncbi:MULTISPECIES: immunity protein Tsi6 family protein [Pseudomonas]|uniref:immunity protein Tsi6 family protein n=1 Tax=Pseudomonas TaxID=286 RepID=UPI002DBF37F0|nr:immunity protein Tsi6 family protein [Pseudomonas asiatica]MEB6589225.1 immunity protein Tsi6 family protein [Pseudomonas asiatica]